MSETPNAPMTPPPGRVYEVLTAGEKIGDYVVESCLTYDILGSLYQVKGPSGEPGTLFVLPAILSDDPDFKDRFKIVKEQQVELAHPYILAVDRSETIDGRICFFAEHVDGKGLPDYLGAAGIYPTFKNPQGILRAQPSEASRNFTPDKIQKVAKEVLEALDFAHSRGVLHLNLTPSNMLLRESGDIKVLGFGLYGSIGTQSIELLISAGIPPVALGPRHVRLNTADIISPEVHLKQEPDARADIYAFGMSLYWLFTGLKPGANYRPPSGIVPGLNPGWDIFLARCLARERSKRYASAKAALADLENISELGTAGYADDIAGQRAKSAPTPRPVVRKSLLIAALGGALLLGAAGTAAYYAIGSEDFGGDIVDDNSQITRFKGEGVPSIGIRISPEGGRLAVMPGNAEFAIDGDSLALSAKDGRYTLQFSSPQGMIQRHLVEVRQGKPVNIHVRMFTEAGRVVVHAAPRIKLSLRNGSGTYALGSTDAKGNFSGMAEPGDYTLLAAFGDKEPVATPITVVKDQVVEKTLEIKDVPAALTVKSTPAGASVTIDGIEVGSTPLTLDEQPYDKEITLVVGKQGFRSETVKLTLLPGERRTVDIPALQSASGTVDYRVRLSGREPTADERAMLTVARSDDGLRARPWSELDKLPVDLPVGRYVVRVEHPDYQPFQTTVDVADRAVADVDINLRARPAKLRLLGVPEGIKYTLRINNHEYPAPPETIPAGVPLKFTVEARDFQPWTTELTAKPRQTLDVTARLSPIPPPQDGEGYTIPYLDTRLAWIPPGENLIGTPADETGHSEFEEPATYAGFTRGFWMGVTEVTQDEYERTLGANPSNFRGKDRPVECVSFEDALRYCRALNRREREAGRLPAGYEYRLPNELEWEYAARGGRRTPYPFGAEIDAAKGLYDLPREQGAPKKSGTANVAAYPQNPYGLHDMSGNVREWIAEPYKTHLPGGRRVDYRLPANALKAESFVIRGGSWRNPVIEARSGYRPQAGQAPNTTADDLGFRIVLAPEAGL